MPPEVVEEYFRILAEEDVEQEKRQQMKQQLSTQWWNSQQLYRIAKNDCWSKDDNDQIQPNHREIPYQLRGRSTLHSVKGKAPNLYIIPLLKGDNDSKEIIICKVIDESHSGNLELTRLDPYGDDPILYTIGTNDTWTHSIDDVMHVEMVYADESGNIELHHPSLCEIKSQLSSSGSDENHKKHSNAVIKWGFIWDLL